MKYSKIFQYAYLVFAALFLFDVIKTYANTGVINYAYLLLAGLAIFIFFFRKQFSKKFDNRNNSN